MESGVSRLGLKEVVLAVCVLTNRVRPPFATRRCASSRSTLMTSLRDNVTVAIESDLRMKELADVDGGRLTLCDLRLKRSAQITSLHSRRQ